MTSRFSFLTVLALCAVPFGLPAQTYFDTNGTSTGYGVYTGTTLDGNFWTSTDGGTSPTGAFPGGDPTVVFSIDENSFTSFGDTIDAGALTSFDIGGLDWRFVGSTLPDNRRNGLNGNGIDLNVVNGSTFDISPTSVNDDLFIEDWVINGSFTKTGLGSLQFRENTINGTITFAAGNAALGDTSGHDYGADSIFNVTSGTLNVNGPGDFTVGGFTGGGDISNSGGGGSTSATITFSGTGTTNFSGTLLDHPNGGSGIRNLAKSGSGTQIFSGDLETEGTTTITNGVFAVDGTHSSAGQYTVSGGQLAGSGTIETATGGNTQNDDIIINGGELAPGRDGTVGTLTLTLGTGTLDLTNVGSGTLLFDLGATTDLVAVNSSITLDNLEFSDFTFTELPGLSVGTYDLFTSSSLNGSLGANLNGGIGSAWTGTLQASGSDIQLVVDAIPEPSSVLYLLGGLSGLLLVRRRRQTS